MKKYKPGERFNKLLKKKTLPMPSKSPMMASTPSPFVSPIRPGALFNTTQPSPMGSSPLTTSSVAQNPMGGMMNGVKPGSLFNAANQVGQGQVGHGQTAGLIDDATKYVGDLWNDFTQTLSNVYKGMQDAASKVMDEYAKAKAALQGPDQSQSSWFNPFQATKAQVDAANASTDYNKSQQDAYYEAQRKLSDEYAKRAADAMKQVWNTTAPSYTAESRGGISNFSLFAETEGVQDPSSISPAPNEPGHYIGNNGRKYRGMQSLAPIPGVTGKIVLFDEGPTSGSSSGGNSGGQLLPPGSPSAPSQPSPTGPFGQPPAAIMSQPQMLKRKSVKMKRTKAKKKFLGFGKKNTATSTPSGPKQFRNNLRATKAMIDSI